MSTPTTEQARKFAASLANQAKIGKVDEEALHCYRKPDGSPLYWRVRVKNTTTGEKWIRPFWWNADSFAIGEPPVPPDGKPLYAMELLVMYPVAQVIVCEGENKADTINKEVMQGGKEHQLVATTSGGATSAFATNWQPLAGREVIVWPDNDQAGSKYAEDIIECVQGIATTTSILEIAKMNLLHKGDAVDYFKTGGTIVGLQQAIESANKAFTPSPSKPDAPDIDLSRLNDAGRAKAQRGLYNPLAIVQMTCAADIKPEAIRWLWDGWLARGKFHIFAGQAGTGKTTISIALASTVSMGGCFPDGTRAPVGNVLIWSGEDSAQDTLVPRLIAAGADINRIHFIGDVCQGSETRSFDPATDISAMMQAAAKIGDISLLIVDPVVNAVAGDSHKNGEVRRALKPLVEFGEKLGCAVLGITHFSKGTGGKDPMERVTGSLAFAALARIVLATGKINDNGTVKRIFCRAKSNIGVDSGGFEYDLHQKELVGYKGVFSSYALWGQAVEGTATELLTESAPDDGEGASADQFLRELLANGALPQKVIEADCKGAGYSIATVKRAKKRIGIVSTKSRMEGGWFWSLPSKTHEEDHEGGEEAHAICVNSFGKSEPLREVSNVWEV